MNLKFAEFELSDDGLRRNGVPVAMNAQALKLLALLAERAGEIVTRDDIRAHIWPNVHVGFEDSINTAVRQVRSALGDSAASPRFIETVRGEGYRFVPPVEARATRAPAKHRFLYAAATLTLIASLTAIWFSTRPRVVTINKTIRTTVRAR